MNKFRAWIIRKLGGYVYLAQTQKIVFKELPCITCNFDVVLPPPEWDKVISESEKIKLANREVAEKIGRYVMDNGLYEIARNYDIESNCEKVRYKIRVVQPPKEHWRIDGVYYDPNEYITSINFEDWMMMNENNKNNKNN